MASMQISTIGIDIGKNSFHFVGFDARGGIVMRRQCSRTQLIRALARHLSPLYWTKRMSAAAAVACVDDQLGGKGRPSEPALPYAIRSKR
jgi:hypothetical protein